MAERWGGCTPGAPLFCSCLVTFAHSADPCTLSLMQTQVDAGCLVGLLDLSESSPSGRGRIEHRIPLQKASWGGFPLACPVGMELHIVVYPNDSGAMIPGPVPCLDTCIPCDPEVIMGRNVTVGLWILF